MASSNYSNSHYLKEIYNHLNQSTQDTNCTSNSTDKLCFTQGLSKVYAKFTPDLEGACSVVVLVGYAQYYTALNVSNALTCVSSCSNSSKDHYDCHRGECYLVSEGPTCFCEYSDLYWYTGDRCQVVINKRGVYGGVAVGLAVLLIIIITLAIFAYRNKNRNQSHQEADLNERWYEEGWEANVPEGFTVRNPETMTWGGSESGGFASSREYFRPSLDKVDTSAQLKTWKTTSDKPMKAGREDKSSC
uniref:Mucin-3B-like n=1 Tax=Geotrypetes seraphini TaxID=260995 RepID=A0A6P8P6F1_GEOSA|nr:mucin-3B-like [Geotrypetes seraphini]